MKKFPLKGTEIPEEGLRILANTEQMYEQWINLRRSRAALPATVVWKKINDMEYLYIRDAGQIEPKSQGPKTAASEQRYAGLKSAIDDVEQRLDEVQRSLAVYMAQHRALKLPRILDLPGKILRDFDLRGWLGVSLLVVGTNAFAAYEIEARDRFAVGLNETEDFDLAWRGNAAAVAGVRQPILTALRSIDPTFALNPKKPYQALNVKGYEVELLAAPSVMPSLLSLKDGFSPAPLIEQEWLLLGRPVRHVVSDYSGGPVPLVVPDPRWMGLHKIWLSQKPERDPLKTGKDRKQGNLLLQAVARNMQHTYPMDTDFVLELPYELLPVFNQWAQENNYIPQKPAVGWQAKT